MLSLFFPVSLLSLGPMSLGTLPLEGAVVSSQPADSFEGPELKRAWDWAHGNSPRGLCQTSLWVCPSEEVLLSIQPHCLLWAIH